MRPGDVTAGRPVNLQRRPGTLLVFDPPPTPAEKCEDTSKACREGGGTHGEAGTHTVQEAFGDRVELRLPHRGAVQGSSGGRRRGGAAESRRLQAAGRDGAAGKVMEREEGKRVEVKPRGKGGGKNSRSAPSAENRRERRDKDAGTEKGIKKKKKKAGGGAGRTTGHKQKVTDKTETEE